MSDRDSKGRYVKGHGCPPEVREKIIATKKAHPQSHSCWMKGLTKETDERIAKMAIAKTGKKVGPRPNRQGIRNSVATEFKKGLIPAGGFETRFKSGLRHPLWKGGITSEHDKIRRSKEYNLWRNAVYRRDHFHCQICGKHCEQNDIVAHHINSFSIYPDQRFLVENGITFCRSCHLKQHREESEKSCALAI